MRVVVVVVVVVLGHTDSNVKLFVLHFSPLCSSLPSLCLDFYFVCVLGVFCACRFLSGFFPRRLRTDRGVRQNDSRVREKGECFRHGLCGGGEGGGLAVVFMYVPSLWGESICR